MEFVKAKTILTKAKDGSEWYGVDYNMNLYRGCSYGCIYCDSRSDCYHIDNFDIVKGKENMLHILENELSKKRTKGVIGIGAMSDTYNPMEIKSKNNVIIKFTITTPDDKLSKIIEPNVCISSKRLEAIKILNDNGIFTGIMMNPVLPFITDKEDEIKKLVELASRSSAKFIHTYMGMTLRENQRAYYFDKLDEKFPGLKEKYIKTYGDKYNCLTPNYKQLYKAFTAECDKYGILYKMKDIIRAYKKDGTNDEQISLF